MKYENEWLKSIPIAHRGFHNDVFPENSIGAFVNARKYDYAIELDIQLSADNHIVVFHDTDTYRMTKEEGLIRKLNLGQIKERKLLGGRFEIPTLKEVFHIIGKDAPLLIEIKNPGKVGALEELLCAEIERFKGSCAIQSFNAYSLQLVKKRCPQIPRGLLLQNSQNKNNIVKHFFWNCISDPDFISYDIKDLPQKNIKTLRENGMLILGWTIKTEKQLAKAQKYCDNIIFESINPENKQRFSAARRTVESNIFLHKNTENIKIN